MGYAVYSFIRAPTHGFLIPHKSAPPNGFSIGLAVFAGLSGVHTQTTEHTESAAITHTYAL